MDKDLIEREIQLGEENIATHRDALDEDLEVAQEFNEGFGKPTYKDRVFSTLGILGDEE